MAFDARRLLVQPRVAIITMGIALVASAAGLASAARSVPGGLDLLVLASLLMIAVVGAYQFPIYVRHNTKITVMSVPVYLMAALLPPGFAALAVLLSVGVSEITVRHRRGTLPTDIMTMSARWTLIALIGSALAHLTLPIAGPMRHDLPLVVAGVLMWTLDLATLPISLTPICNERPLRIIRSALAEGGVAEAAQYALGLIGVVLAMQQRWLLLMLIVPIGLIHLTFKKEMDTDTFQLLESMADSVDIRGSYTVGHSRRVHELVAGILSQLDMHGQEARQILVAARLHDLGKMGLPDSLLIHPGALGPEEQGMIESYPASGAELMRAYPDFSRGLEMVRNHHERWDGTGYPDRLAGPDIPFGARVIAVADAFDAMTSERPFRRSLSTEAAAEILLNGAGRQWDPDVVRAFLTSIGYSQENGALVPARQSATELQAGRHVLA